MKMAFVTSAPALPRTTSRPAATCPRMSQGQVSRRTALRAAAFSLAAFSTSAALAKFDLEELKEDVEELKYDEEVVQVGPDAAEKNVTRIKKKEEPPAYREEEKALVQEEENEYEDMVAKEKSEAAKIKAKFSGK